MNFQVIKLFATIYGIASLFAMGLTIHVVTIDSKNPNSDIDKIIKLFVNSIKESGFKVWHLIVCLVFLPEIIFCAVAAPCIFLIMFVSKLIIKYVLIPVLQFKIFNIKDWRDKK